MLAERLQPETVRPALFALRRRVSSHLRVASDALAVWRDHVAVIGEDDVPACAATDNVAVSVVHEDPGRAVSREDAIVLWGRG
jgi:hypothetical protein